MMLILEMIFLIFCIDIYLLNKYFILSLLGLSFFHSCMSVDDLTTIKNTQPRQYKISNHQESKEIQVKEIEES